MIATSTSPEIETLNRRKYRNNIRSGSNKFPLGTPLHSCLCKLSDRLDLRVKSDYREDRTVSLATGNSLG